MEVALLLSRYPPRGARDRTCIIITIIYLEAESTSSLSTIGDQYALIKLPISISRPRLLRVSEAECGTSLSILGLVCVCKRAVTTNMSQPLSKSLSFVFAVLALCVRRACISLVWHSCKTCYDLDGTSTYNTGTSAVTSIADA